MVGDREGSIGGADMRAWHDRVSDGAPSWRGRQRTGRRPCADIPAQASAGHEYDGERDSQGDSGYRLEKKCLLRSRLLSRHKQ